jgi:ribosomal-protein-alanine N-acetyltransferase
MQGFSLRPATIDDLPKVLEIERRFIPVPWTEENFLAEMHKPYSEFLVMTDDETDEVIAGYIVYWTLFDECQILDVVVDLPFRGMGVAQLLMRRAVQRATQQNIRRMVLEVRKSNLPAIQLYQKLAFAITQVRKAFYSNGEDAYQMCLPLDGPPLDF